MTNAPSSQQPPSQSIGRIESLDLAGMDRLATALVAQLPCPMTIGLVGTLGAGKTTLVQAIARAAEIDSSEVTSPTFTLLQTHRGQITLHHLDTYRLADEDEFLELGVDELFDDENAWTLVEWAERFLSVMPTNTLWVCINLIDDAGQVKSDSPANNDKRQVNFYCDDAVIATTITDVIQAIST